MKRKLKIIFRILLIVLITALCIVLGFHTRHNKAIVVTGFTNSVDNSKTGYLFKSETGRMVMIDGGSSNESKKVLDEIKRQGGIVEVWIITLPYVEHAQVLLDALKDDQITIGGIYIGLNEKEWYEKNEDPSRVDFVMDFFDALDSDLARNKVYYLHAKDEINIDNLNFKLLKSNHPEYTQNAGRNQSLVVRVSNNFKSVIYLSEFGTEYQEEFINDNQDEIKVKDINLIENRIENYITGFGDSITVEIW